MRCVLALTIGLLAATPAWAEHTGPKAEFSEAPKSVVELIEGACKARGFATSRPEDGEVVCQGPELVRRIVEFRPGGPPADPRITPQQYHHFKVTVGPLGSEVSESTNGVAYIAGREIDIEPHLVAARIVDDRVKEFYTSLSAAKID